MSWRNVKLAEWQVEKRPNTKISLTCDRIHNILLSWELINGPNVMVWYITLGWKGTNTLAYLGPFVSQEENGML
jgi:hypothetical protein